MAALNPHRAALIAPVGDSGRWQTMTFGELDALSSRYAVGLSAHGIGRGMRAVLMVPASLELFGLVFGLFKAGAVLVMVDPGMGVKPMLQCIEEVEPQAFIGIAKAQLLRLVFSKSFRSVKKTVTVGGSLGFGGVTSTKLLAQADGPFQMVAPTRDEEAAILFTSGSTGIPKGAVYTHDVFDAQVQLLKSTYGIEPGERELSTFPLFALFSPALGMTTVLPQMDFRAPASAAPERIVEAITTHGCTSMFGSPALLDNLGRYGAANGLRLPTLRRVISAGAPVRTDVLERMQRMLTGEAQIHTPFGATEALPVTTIGSREVLSDTSEGAAQGHGVCVGRPVEGVTVRIMRITDDAVAEWDESLAVAPGTVGEIVVEGPIVTREYFGRPAQTRLAKIRRGGAVLHRMGDVGYFDTQGRLWMCGRKSHRVETVTGPMFTAQVEEVFNQHPGVKRTALVGRQQPVLLVEKDDQRPMPNDVLVAELLELAALHATTRAISDIRVYPKRFPVDRRHNAKIERERLTKELEATR